MKITKPEIVEKLFAFQYEKWDAQNKIEQRKIQIVYLLKL